VDRNFSLSSTFEMPNFFHAIMGAYLFLLLTLLFCVFPSVFLGFSLVSLPILFCNTTIIFLIFPLKGPLFHKIALATLSNAGGFGWEYFLACLASGSVHYFGGLSGAVYFVVVPFLELFWVVSIFALGLSVLASHKEIRSR